MGGEVRVPMEVYSRMWDHPPCVVPCNGIKDLLEVKIEDNLSIVDKMDAIYPLFRGSVDD